jgi:hypothetical protein
MILMTYLSVLNILLLQSLFSRFSMHLNPSKKMSFPIFETENVIGSNKAPLEIPNSKQTHHRNSASTVHQLLSLKSTCPAQEHNLFIALVPGNVDISSNNDLTSHSSSRIMAEIRHALRHGPLIHAHVYLIETVDTFFSSHRKWCQELNAQTRRRAQCDFILLPLNLLSGLDKTEKSNQNNVVVERSNQDKRDNTNFIPSHVTIFDYILRLQPCLEHMVLLNDNVHIPANFVKHLAEAQDNKVQCLASSHPTHSENCPVTAYRLPRVFMLAYTTEFENETIDEAAKVLQIHGQGLTAARVAFV